VERSDQENFWAHKYAEEYINKNNKFDNIIGSEAWKFMLKNIKSDISDYLELGCNIGRNLDQIKIVFPNATASIIEISKPAFEHVTAHHQIKKSFNGPILESSFEKNSFDLVFTVGVLIHIKPDLLLDHMKLMFDYSKKYVLMGEYFNRTPVSIEYQGKMNLLFKRDFGKLFIETFPVELVDYGFLWSYVYDRAGFDDITWWLFEKK
jgi:pseudaminic acid biosynthesis-associated methylase